MHAMPERMEPNQAFFTAKNPDKSGTHRIAYYDWGDPAHEDVLICVHGLTRNARDFDFVAQELSKDRRVIAIDMPGRGQSDRLENPDHYNYGTYLADCLAFLDNFHLRRVDWLGTSMGGIIGMMLASIHPKRIHRLALNDVGSFVPKEALKRIMDYVSAAPASFDSREQAEFTARHSYRSFGLKTDAEWEHIFRHSIVEQPDGTFTLAYDPAILDPVRKETANFESLNDIDLSGLWEKIKAPTLIIRGAESDLLNEETVSAMRSNHLRAFNVTIPGAGHAPALYHPSQVGIVADWFRNHELGGLRVHGL